MVYLSIGVQCEPNLRMPTDIATFRKELVTHGLDKRMGEQYFNDDTMLERFVRICEIDEAMEIMRDYLDHINRIKLHELTTNNIGKMCHRKQKVVHYMGKTHKSEPVFVIRMKYLMENMYQDGDVERGVGFLMHIIHHKIWGTIHSPDTVILVDFRDWVVSQFYRDTFTKMISTFKSYYPRRLRHVYLMYTPWVFEAIWKFCKTMIDENMIGRVQFLQTHNDVVKMLHEMIPAENISEEYGGKLKKMMPLRRFFEKTVGKESTFGDFIRNHE
jgi:hypothetical protein